jgi:chromosome segregation ATPase
MFLLFLNTTLVKAQGVPTNSSPDPKLIMDSATLTLPLHKRIAELEGLLADANATRDSSRQKIEDLNRQLSEGNDAQERLKTRVADLTFQYTNLKGQYTKQTVDRDADQVEIVRLKTELSKAQSQSANKDDEIARLNTELSTEKANAANAAGEIARLKTELSKAQNQSANKDDEIARLKELLNVPLPNFQDGIAEIARLKTELNKANEEVRCFHGFIKEHDTTSAVLMEKYGGSRTFNGITIPKDTWTHNGWVDTLLHLRMRSEYYEYCDN